MQNKNGFELEILEIKTCKSSPNQKYPRIYFHPEKYNPIEDLLTGTRFNRPYKLYRKYIREILRRVGLPTNVKVRWSQYAGCSCGCSPGFIVYFPANFDIFVTYRIK